MGFRSPTRANQEKMERDVSAAAKHLGDGVQKIVLAAKAKQGGSDWKVELLQLLGAASPPTTTTPPATTTTTETSTTTPSDVDVLLANASCETFVQRCVESDLPPNLIHCMRLLRVLELQHAANVPDGQEDIHPVAEVATGRVARLLCRLCSDPTVGEVLRPHLFGLLALSGASYPPSGVHVAKAAHSVIVAFSEHCLTRQLVWFVHDRKMVLHMTDDVKELCGLVASTTATASDASSGPPSSSASAPPVPRALDPAGAERAGLWAIALETVVKLVAASCRFRTVELLKDFESVGGYEVLSYAIRHSTEPHGARLIELLSVLACCPNEATDVDEKFATNIRVFDAMEQLLWTANPLLVECRRQGRTLDLSSPPPLPELARLSIQIRLDPPPPSPPSPSSTDDDPDAAPSYHFDAASALLGAALQLFADHPDNYGVLEDRQHILTYYVLAFPCFRDDDLKSLVLKTLEFVLTGVGMNDEVSPIRSCVEVFFALTESLLLEASEVGGRHGILSADLDLVGRSLEKLLQFDQRVAPLVVDSGILTTSLDAFLVSVTHQLDGAKCSEPKPPKPPPTATSVDGTFCVVCRVLKLLVAHKPRHPTSDSSPEPTPPSSSSTETESPATNLHTLLELATFRLGTVAARGAAGVFEAFMASSVSPADLRQDARFALQLVGDLAAQASRFESSGDSLALETILERETVVLSLVRAVLEGRSAAQDAFRDCGGFDAVLRLFLAFAKVDRRGSPAPLLLLLQTVITLLDAALGFRSRNPVASGDAAPVLYSPDLTVDPSSLQLSSGTPSALNRNFLRQRGFYLDLAVALGAAGLLGSETVGDVMELCFCHVDPILKVLRDVSHASTIRNPDALRLVLAVAVFAASDSDAGMSIAKPSVDAVVELCRGDKVASTAREIASCGLGASLTNPEEFGPVLFGQNHALQKHFVQILSLISSLRMSFMDFVSIVRFVTGPLLSVESADGRVRLPVISSSIKTRLITAEPISNGSNLDSKTTDDEVFSRLDLLCEIARTGDSYSRLVLGGESINTIAVLMHQVKLDERLRTAAESKNLRYLEIESIDASALVSEPSLPAGTPSNATGGAVTDKVWSPLVSSGFTYSLWLRHDVEPDGGVIGNLYILDISSPLPSTGTAPNLTSAFLSVWYDVQNQRFNVLSSASYRGEPTSFPVSPLLPEVWHHVLITYSPSKRSMISRKSAFSLFVNGRGLEAEVRVDSVSLPPSSRVVIGAPNPTLASSGIVRGTLPIWEAGPAILLSTVLLDLDATAIFAYGPSFPGVLWGDRPQRTSLAATGTLAFSMLAGCGEPGSIASALKKRDVQRLETAGYSVLGHTEDDKDDLSQLGLLCTIPPECVVFAFQAASLANKLRNASVRQDRNLQSERLVNLARLNFSSESVSTDAVLYGKSAAIIPLCFADCLQWAGGPSLLMPLVNSSNTPLALAMALEIVREGTLRHPPNLEMMQAGGGYRILAVLLKEKGFADVNALDECLGFAVNGFEPRRRTDRAADPDPLSLGRSFSHIVESDWVLSDVDAMKHLLLNHQVWDLSKCGPDIPLRLLSALNVLVSQKSIHKAFNARRLHLVGIVRWSLHLMLEGAELYSAGDKSIRESRANDGSESHSSSMRGAWYCESPLVSDVLVGGDPGNPFLLECKNLLRRVLTFMLTPGDLEALADSIVYTLSISGSAAIQSGSIQSGSPKSSSLAREGAQNEDVMLPGPAARLYLVRLLEELIVDGVNEIAASLPLSPPKRKESGDKDSSVHNTVQYHAGGVASPGQPYLSTSVARGKMKNGAIHPKHQQAQAFLSAFAGFLTPAWFATVLEGCREEASASAILRLMILMLQGSSSFETMFWGAGGFAPFVVSVPKYSTCAGIILPILSELLHVPILHLHSFPSLHSEQLCEVFDVESSGDFVVSNHEHMDPSNGIFALLAECLGRNIKYVASQNKLALKARETNDAVIELISHRHEASTGFQDFCSTPAFLEPLSQALCLIYTDRVGPPLRGRRRALLSDVPRDLTPTERFVGGSGDVDSGGIGMVRLLRMVSFSAISFRPRAAATFYSLFRSFPIHASSQQVEAFHLVLIEQCCSVAKEVVDHGNALSLANCLGLCSVLLDQLLSGFFTAEAALEAVRLSVSLLNAVTEGETDATRVLTSAEYSMLSMDAAHLACLICVAALRMSLPTSRYDPGDEDLQAAILVDMDASVDSLLLVPKRDRKNSKRIPSIAVARPSQNAKIFPLWQSSSIARCLVAQRYTLYPDLSESENPEAAVIAPLLVELHRLLTSSREDIRSLAVSLLVALLQNRPNALSQLLVAEITTGNTTETIDIVNRGGFRALLAAHEAATVADRSGAPSTSVKRKYSSFFDWFEKNQNQVQLVFHAVNDKALKLFPGLERVTTPQEEAIETEQKNMLMRLTAQAAGNTILGGIERGELARRCAERTTDSHSRWKRQGFDDLAFGATKWKILLRQLKGSSSVWEGGQSLVSCSALSLGQRISDLQSREGVTVVLNLLNDERDFVKRWKLDLTEGHERQRRRLLPNYEFHGIYNVDEDQDGEGFDGDSAALSTINTAELPVVPTEFLVGPEMEATAELLKDLNLKRTHRSDDALEYDEVEADDGATIATATTLTGSVEGLSLAAHESETVEQTPTKGTGEADVQLSKEVTEESDDSSSYGLITGLLQAGDWPEKSYNVSRCTGLEVTKALLLWCQEAIYVIDGFEQTGGAGMDGKITRVEREQSSFYISLRPKDFKASDERTAEEGVAITGSGAPGSTKSRKKASRARSERTSQNDVLYQHRSQRIAFTELYSVFKRRYQLQQIALEFYDVNRNGTLIAFATHEEREEILSKVLLAKLPNSIFNSSYGTFISYAKFMNNLKSKVVSQWINGKMTNFEFLMHLNSFAGRSFNDLTQYPVFPWVIADYDSEEIDLNDPKTYRDLSKPMGAIGSQRAKQFQERYDALASTCFSEDDPPPFHYGTHYSCAAYVLYYLMRLEPFSRLALALQGGRFDVADRLFHDVGRSWKSASAENLQDVRELIPEFFYLPDFFLNTNHFDFGETQRGKTVHDVSLPKWAKGDPQRFVRINRQALESDYVSRNLHQWVDLIFGFKQRGKEAIESLNVFVHVTYEDQVDLDTMVDPVQRASTIAQIQNFGQTPSRLERKPFPQRMTFRPLKEKTVDFAVLASLVPSTPPFCVVGAPHRVTVKSISSDTCRLGLSGQNDPSVGDLCLFKGQVIGVGRNCTLILPAKRYYRFGGVNNGVSVHALTASLRYKEINKALSFHDALHRAVITAAKASLNGEWLVTGCADSTLRVWRYDGTVLRLKATLCGHEGSHIRCLDLSTEYGVIVSGCGRGRVLLWDLRTLTFVRALYPEQTGQPVQSASINHSNGNLVTLVGGQLNLFDINGQLLGRHDLLASNPPHCAVATDCPEWMEDGIVAVSGHANGDVWFWSIRFDDRQLVRRQMLHDNPHTCAITALRVTLGQDATTESRASALILRSPISERQDTLLVGDASGKVSLCKVAELISCNPTELAEVVTELEQRDVVRGEKLLPTP